MKPSTFALHTLLLLSASSPAASFAPPTFSSFADPVASHVQIPITTSSTTLPAYIGEEYNAVPPRFARGSEVRRKAVDEPKPTKDLVQRLSPEERTSNLEVMKQIFSNDLAVLLRGRDYAGWIEAKRDLTKRQNDDPWFGLNDRLKEAVQMGEDEEAAEIQTLINKVGGPPPGVTHRREYAVITEIYDTPMSLTRAEHIVRSDYDKRSREKHLRRVAERKANERAEEEAANDPTREDREAAERRELFMRRVYTKIDAENKVALKRAEEIMKDRHHDDDTSPIERAWAVAKNEVMETKLRKNQELLEENKEMVATDDNNIPESEKISNDAAPATPKRDPDDRPRVPGDKDVARGEIAVDHISENSDVTTNHVRVKSTCSYNNAESDPAARRHVFSYTVGITNIHPTRTIRLEKRRFEIQTVGTSKKDLVEGDGVTGRRPVLKPGETFKYTSLAPLNVRPLGTTIVAARMRGTYKYEIVSDENEREEGEAELGTFHFVFPLEQRVQPFEGNHDDEDEDEDE